MIHVEYSQDLCLLMEDTQRIKGIYHRNKHHVKIAKEKVVLFVIFMDQKISKVLKDK